jgi:PPOX class probable F420-dependent enzyme
MATTADDARRFLHDHHRAVLVTTRAGGRPQVSPVGAGVDDEGRVIISSRETAMKTKNLRRSPDATLCVLSDEFFGDWVYVSGRAEVVPLPEAMELLVDHYRRVAGEHPDWDDYRAAMEKEKRVLLRITIDEAGPNISG